MTKLTTIDVEITRESERMIYATSPQLRQLYISGSDEAKVLATVPAAIEVIYEGQGTRVRAVPGEPTENGAVQMDVFRQEAAEG